MKRGRRYVHCSNRSRWRLWKRGRGTLSRSVVVTTLTGERRSFDCWLIGYHGITSIEHEDASVSGADADRGAARLLTRVLANVHVTQTSDASQLLQRFQWCARGLALPIRHDSNGGETDPNTHNLKRGHNLTEDYDGGDRGHE